MYLFIGIELILSGLVYVQTAMKKFNIVPTFLKLMI